MATQEEIFRKILKEHQVDYSLLTTGKFPCTYCTCIAEIRIDLPKDWRDWNDHMVREAKEDAFITHQAEVFLKELDAEGFTNTSE